MTHIFKIRNNKTGEFSSGGAWPTFSKVGKTWTSTRSINSHIALFKNDELLKRYKDCSLVAFELKELDATSIEAMVNRRKRMSALTKKYGSTFASFVDKLDKGDLTDTFRWIVYIDSTLDKYRDEAKESLRMLKVKKTDYRYSEFSFAFTRKEDAAKFRLTISTNTHVFDGTTLIEDEE